MENGRPDGWNKTALDIIEKSKMQGTLDLSRRALIEAGADAYIMGLYEECEKYGGMWIKLDKVDDMIMLHIGKEKE